MCPKHGEVSNDEIVEGYEYAKGHYIELKKEGLDALRSDRDKAFTIDAFVASGEIDPIYFDGRMYYLIPSGTSGAEPYALLEAAMERKKRWGIGQVVLSGRQQLAVVRPLDGVLTMAMLNYDAEIRKPTEMKTEFIRAQTESRKLRLAEQLVDEWQQRNFDFSQYKDRYREKVKNAIEAKRKGKTIESPEEEEPLVINLMDALKQSVVRAGGGTNKRPSGRRSPAVKRKHTSRQRRA
jgi:DNA end-binding protein Ku